MVARAHHASRSRSVRSYWQSDLLAAPRHPTSRPYLHQLAL